MDINDLEYCETTTDKVKIFGGVETMTDIQTYLAPGYADITASAAAVGDSSNTFTTTNSIVDDTGWMKVSKAEGIALATARDSNNFSQSYQKQTVILITNKY
ncbi:hypothetical protein [Nodularia sphaerocarpa]|uniref:hypothetical protein n=1 Tax=Nodularia sphaerocarpa TaxID=137816 RepID=UPI001EFACB29|nr:hypothetical protein [Nodularia sphaerocarpa]MDB9375540.1 hypothetical protein [Nodularia sphaerocarpa CS-585]MDB9379630.1 hypothetical protein [Nodularia sphaerocarpa CS-585A2]ULP73853.1 hypothetical protein BDGGKGIB_03513 [Nodularia sphaerocarpa UHCC 0038]